MIEKKAFEGGLEYLEISNSAANACIALQGAHLFSYDRSGEQPLLWLSSRSRFEPGKAIRGGVPVCWPWFGPHPSEPSLPQHGFARTSMWELLEAREDGDDVSEVTLGLENSPETLKLWPFRFDLLLRVTVSHTLSLSLLTGSRDERSFEISSALHSYLAVSDIGRTVVKGLEGARYFDKVTGQTARQAGPLSIACEIDRVYGDVHYPISVSDGDRSITVAAHGSASAVVWNPWREKCAAMADMPDDGWQTMLCVEAANAMDDARVIRPGEEHALTAIIS